MTPPEPEARDQSESRGSVPPVPQPTWLDRLRDYDDRLRVVLEEIRIRPELLDDQANDLHENMVIPSYQLMLGEAAKKSGKRWGRPNRRRFEDRYQAVASKWPAYRQALIELKRAQDGNGTEVYPMIRLEKPRTGYSQALRSFYNEFTDTLQFLFPGSGEAHRLG